MAALAFVPSQAEDALFDVLSQMPQGKRSVVALAGPSGMVTSTVAEHVSIRLNREIESRATTLSASGFLLDNVLLNSLGRAHRKGAPDTFDTGTLSYIIRRLRANAETDVAVPIYDPQLDLVRSAARLIHQRTEIVIVEGSYLLLEAMPWSPLMGQFDLTVMLKADDATVRRSLEDKFEQLGLSTEETQVRIEDQDLPNARYIREKSATADHIFSVNE